MLALAAFKTTLGKLFRGEPPGFPTTDAATGARWAAAYRAFVARAQAGPTGPTPVAESLADAEARLAGGLAGAFAIGRAKGPDGVAKVTPELDKAFCLFWMGPVAAPTPVSFAAPGVVGTVASIPPDTLAPLLAAVFRAGVPATGPAPSAQAQADALVAALATWTRTVTVAYAPPTGGTGTLQ